MRIRNIVRACYSMPDMNIGSGLGFIFFKKIIISFAICC